MSILWGVTGLERIRRRVPLVVFVLLLVLVLMLVGFACACFSDNPMQALERASSAAISMPALIEMWGVVTVMLALAALVHGRLVVPTGRASPAFTQRFLF